MGPPQLVAIEFSTIGRSLARSCVLLSARGDVHQPADGRVRKELHSVTTAAHSEKSVTHWRKVFAFLLFGVVILAALALASSSRAAVESPPPPQVWSDKADYAPGEQVTLSGANWAVGEAVHIRVNDDAIW